MLQKLLEKLGYTVFVASSGTEGLAILKNNIDLIDLATIDMMLPDMNGEELAKEMRKISPEISLLVLSGLLRDSDDIENIMKLENIDFLGKPHSLQELGDIINKF